jgi:cobalt-zinc-cadmium efflux system outer membrane protein
MKLGAKGLSRRSGVAAKADALGLVMLLLGTVASAQTPGLEQRPSLAERFVDTASGLTLADAITGALGREPSLRASRAELEAARGTRQQAGLRADPSLMFERREEPAGTDNQTTLQVSMPLELVRRSARIAVAEHELEVAERVVADRTRMLINDIKMRYGQAASAAREVAVSDNLAYSARRDLELLRHRVDEGASPPLDRDRITVEVHRLDAARLQAAGRAEAAMAELKRSLGLRPDSPMKLKDTLEVLAPLPAPGDARDLLERADVREAEARVRLAQARINQSQAEGRFDLTLFGSYMRMNTGFSQRGFGESGDLERVRGLFHYASVGAMVMVPLWNRNQGAIAAARGEHAAEVARLEAAQLSAQTGVAAATAQLAQSTQALRVLADGVVLARHNFEVVRQTYELGRGTLSDVLVEQRRYLEFENEYTTALREVFDARTSLEFARGEMK